MAWSRWPSSVLRTTTKTAGAMPPGLTPTTSRIRRSPGSSAPRNKFPVLVSAVIAFDCRIVEVRSVGSHNVFFGAVETVRAGPGGPALVYHDRAYKQV